MLPSIQKLFFSRALYSRLQSKGHHQYQGVDCLVVEPPKPFDMQENLVATDGKSRTVIAGKKSLESRFSALSQAHRHFPPRYKLGRRRPEDQFEIFQDKLRQQKLDDRQETLQNNSV